MDTDALGRKALTEILRKQAGLSQSFVSELVNGHKSPSLDLAFQIEETTGIPPHFWLGDKTSRPARMWERILEMQK